MAAAQSAVDGGPGRDFDDFVLASGPITHWQGVWMTARFVRVCLLGFLLGRGDGGTEADRRGAGAECTADDDCFDEGQRCLTRFEGGYCGNSGCATNADCPDGSGCVVHDDGETHCFRFCLDEPECNLHRTGDGDANCSSSVEWTDADTTEKACVRPSG